MIRRRMPLLLFEDMDEAANYLAENNSESILLDGLDAAFLGAVESAGEKPVALYDQRKILEILVHVDGMSYDEAVEHFYYNVFSLKGSGGSPRFLYGMVDSWRKPVQDLGI